MTDEIERAAERLRKKGDGETRVREEVRQKLDALAADFLAKVEPYDVKGWTWRSSWPGQDWMGIISAPNYSPFYWDLTSDGRWLQRPGSDERHPVDGPGMSGNLHWLEAAATEQFGKYYLEVVDGAQRGDLEAARASVAVRRDEAERTRRAEEERVAAERRQLDDAARRLAAHHGAEATRVSDSEWHIKKKSFFRGTQEWQVFDRNGVIRANTRRPGEAWRACQLPTIADAGTRADD